LESSTLPGWRYSDTVSFARTDAEAPPGEEHRVLRGRARRQKIRRRLEEKPYAQSSVRASFRVANEAEGSRPTHPTSIARRDSVARNVRPRAPRLALRDAMTLSDGTHASLLRPPEMSRYRRGPKT